MNPSDDDERRARNLEIGKQFERSQSNGDVWGALRLFHAQLFEIEGLTAHLARRVEFAITKLDAIRERRRSSPEITPGPDNRSRLDDVHALQRQIEQTAMELKGDVAAMQRQHNAVVAIIGEAPNPEKKIEGSGVLKAIHMFNLRRTVAVVAIGACIVGASVAAAGAGILLHLLH